MKYSLRDAKKFERGAKKGWIYNSASDFENVNIVLLKLTGNHGKIRNEKSDRVYYILKGKGQFITKNENYVTGENDVVIIPRNTPYDFEPYDDKGLECLLINCPAFDRKSEFKLDKLSYHKKLLKFEFKNAREISWDGWKGLAYNSKDDFKRASALYIEVTKRHGLSKTTKSDRIYYVLEGNGEFIIKDKKYKVDKTDVIIVEKNTPYDYKALGKGTLKMFMLHVPAFDPKYVVELE